MIASSKTLIAPGRPWQPGDPLGPVESRIPPSDCRGLPPMVLRRAQLLTITLLGQSPQVGAAWFANGRSTPLSVRPVGGAPSAIWLLTLPMTSGKLVVHMWFPVGVTPLGAVSQERADYKVAIRRKAAPSARSATIGPRPAARFHAKGHWPA
jgi:hypothetical protein